MFGLKARDTTKPVGFKNTAMMERKPLKDLDVNRTRLQNLPSKDGLVLEKGNFATGFKVYDDGEILSHKRVNFKQPLISSASSGAVKKTLKAENVLQGLDGIIKKKSDPNSGTTATNKEQVMFDEPLSVQLAMMHVNNAVKKKTEHTVQQDALQCENLKCIPLDDIIKTQGQKNSDGSETSGTGAIKKNSCYATRTAEHDSVRELKTFTLNAEAEEWKVPNSGTTPDTAEPGDKIPTFWELFGDGTPDVPPVGARKIVGRRETAPGEVGQNRNSVPQSLTSAFSYLDDRSGEIMRYNRYKEARRRKAIEAMRVEQERQQRKTLRTPEPVAKQAHSNGLYRNVEMVGVKDQWLSSPTVTWESNSARHTAGGNGYQSNTMWNSSQVSKPPMSLEKGSGEQSNICIYKYPTPPNVPIRYDPTELLKMNYQEKYTGKGIQKNQRKSMK